MQKESNNLLDDEVKELGDALTSTLFSVVSKAIDVNHAIVILIEHGLISDTAIRNLSILRDFDIENKNPLNKQMSIYYNLSVKYDLSVTQLIRVIKNRKV